MPASDVAHCVNLNRASHRVSLKLRARKIPDYTAADLLLFNFAFKDRPAPPSLSVLVMTHTNTHKTLSHTQKNTFSPPAFSDFCFSGGEGVRRGIFLCRPLGNMGGEGGGSRSLFIHRSTPD